MALGADTYGKNTMLASLRRPAWNGLGQVFDKPVSTEEMLDLSHLSNWNLRMEELDTGEYCDKTEFKVLRDNPLMDGRTERLGIVGTRYHLFSNEELFDFGDTLTTQRRRWETAGALDGGRRVFATLVSTDDLVLDPNGSADTIRKYLLLTSSHDGSGTILAKKIDTRVECWNTLNIAFREAGPEFKIRHTQKMEEKISQAKKALGFADLYDEVFEREAMELFAKEMTLVQFEKIVLDMFPEPEEDKKGAAKKWNDKVDDILNIWQNSTKSVGNLPNNAWKGLQVLTEHNQWFRGIRKGDMENYYAAGAGFDLRTNRFRTEAYERMREFALTA